MPRTYEPGTRVTAKVRPRRFEVVEGESTEVDLEIDGEHHILLVRMEAGRLDARIIDPDQRWFWTPECQAGEREADEDIEQGRGEFLDGDTDFLDSLR